MNDITKLSASWFIFFYAWFLRVPRLGATSLERRTSTSVIPHTSLHVTVDLTVYAERHIPSLHPPSHICSTRAPGNPLVRCFLSSTRIRLLVLISVINNVTLIITYLHIENNAYWLIYYIEIIDLLQATMLACERNAVERRR